MREKCSKISRLQSQYFNGEPKLKFCQIKFKNKIIKKHGIGKICKRHI